MPKGKVRKVSKKRVSKKRGRRVSIKKRKVMKGGNQQAEPYKQGDIILYLVNGVLKYGEITIVNTNTFMVKSFQQIGASQQAPIEEVNFKNVINMFETNLYDKMNEYGIDLKIIFEKGLGMTF